MTDVVIGALVGLAVGTTLVIVVWYFVNLARAILRLCKEYDDEQCDEQPGPNEED